MDKYYDKFITAFNIEVAGLLAAFALILLKIFFTRLRQDISMWFSVAFSLRSGSIARIHIYLRRLLYRIEGDRASLFNFSGGSVNPANKSLLMTCVSEVFEDGIGSAIYDRRKLNAKQFEPFIEELLLNKFVIVTDTYNMTNSSLSGFLISQSTRYAGFKLITDKSGDIYGFICVEFCRMPDISFTEAEFIKELSHTKDKISLFI